MAIDLPRLARMHGIWVNPKEFGPRARIEGQAPSPPPKDAPAYPPKSPGKPPVAVRHKSK